MYLLDTNILSELIKKNPNQYLLIHLRSKSSQSLFTSSICVMELRFGSALRKDFSTFWQKINKEILSRVNIIPFGENDAIIAGDILSEMRKAGQSIGLEDVFIAATALTHKFIMITANTRHFSRIRSLAVENWLTE